MRGKSYTKELKEEILREVKEVGNVSLVSRRHGVSKSTIFTWIKTSKAKDEIKVKPGRKALIDIFDRSIIDYHMGLHCEAKDATALLRKCLIRRNLFEEGAEKPVIRTDNGPQFVSHKFSECCEELKIEHERIPVN